MDNNGASIFLLLLTALLGLFYTVYRYGGYRQRQLDKPAVMDAMEKIYWQGYDHGEQEQKLFDQQQGICK